MATMLETIILVVFYAAPICISQWVQSTLTLPRNELKQAPGIYNKTIYLLGGEVNMLQLVEYSIVDDTFIDHGVPYGSERVHGSGQYYTQIDHILYTKDSDADSLSIFDMKTNTFTPQYISNIPSTQGRHACVASTQTQLFVLGGGRNNNNIHTNDVNLYDLSANEWLSNIPPMQQDRSDFSCIVHPVTNVLYAIAGVYQFGIASSIETIEVSDIQSKSWQLIEPLTEQIAWTRCVVYKNTIYVIGGAAQITTTYITTDKVHTINVLTNAVDVLPDRMPVAIADVAPIVVDHILYVFGGWNDVALDNVMMYDLEPQLTQPPTAQSTTTRAPTTQSTQSEAPTAQLTQSEAPTAQSTQSEEPTEQSTQTEAPTAQLTQSEAPTAQSTQSEAPSKVPTTWVPLTSVIAITSTKATNTTNIDAVITPAVDSTTSTVTVTITRSNTESQDGISHEDKSSDRLLTSVIAIAASLLIIGFLLFFIICIFKKYYVCHRKQEDIVNIAGELDDDVPNDIENVADVAEARDSDSGSDGLWNWKQKKTEATTASTKKRDGVLNEIEGEKKIEANGDNAPVINEMRYTNEGAQGPNIFVNAPTTTSVVRNTKQASKGEAIDDI